MIINTIIIIMIFIITFAATDTEERSISSAPAKEQAPSEAPMPKLNTLVTNGNVSPTKPVRSTTETNEKFAKSPDNKPFSKPAVKKESKDNVKHEVKSEAKHEVKHEAKHEVKHEVKQESKARHKPDVQKPGKIHESDCNIGDNVGDSDYSN